MHCVCLHSGITACTLLVASSLLYAQPDQKHPNSPVFKDYRETKPPPLLVQSDVTYKLWETFLLERQAGAGDMLAQHELGIRYLTGRGATPDTARGALWIKKAAEQNLTSAQFNLGILYYHGWGVEWNPFSAYTEFLAAAKKGMTEAEYVMGQFLMDDLVVQRNWEEAYRWVKLAADSGYAPAKETLKEFEKRLAEKPADSLRVGRTDSLSTGSVVFLDFGKDSSSKPDLNILKDVLESGGEELRKALGLASMLEGSLDMDSSEVEAIRHAAEEGSPEALAVLGRCFERGILMKKDPVQAAEMYLRALRLDSPRASELLWKLLQDEAFYTQLKSRSSAGDVHADYVWSTLRGLGFDGILQSKQSWISDEQALKLLEQASSANYSPAMVELGLCYYAGRWVPRSLERANRLWAKAALQGSNEAHVRMAITRVREAGAQDSLGQIIQTLAGAAHGGSILAQVALGFCYERGLGVPENDAQAAGFYRSAAQRGSQDAFRALRAMHDRLRPPGKEFRVED